jgi:hypothetical protein
LAAPSPSARIPEAANDDGVLKYSSILITKTRRQRSRESIAQPTESSAADGCRNIHTTTG